MIYTLDEKISQWLENCYDPDTGELLEGITEEEMFAEIQKIEEDHERLLDAIAADVKNLAAEAAAVKAEKLALADRQKKTENRMERAKRLLAYLTQGQPWKNARHDIRYRKSTELVLDDGFIDWAEINMPGLLRYTDPTPKKDEIKAAIKNGKHFDYAHIEEKQNIQIK